jgi:hypothetical protein
MTEPAVASSDATNISCSIVKDGNSYVINGTKWWTTGAKDPRCKVCFDHLVKGLYRDIEIVLELLLPLCSSVTHAATERQQKLQYNIHYISV